MLPVFTKEIAIRCDYSAINKFNIPSIVLMENAARSCADTIRQYMNSINFDGHIYVFCGTGNNGGDGLALARHLAKADNLTICQYGYEDSMTQDTLTNYIAAKSLGLNITEVNCDFEMPTINSNDMVVEALVGLGGDHQIRGQVEEVLECLNDIMCHKIAIDIPAGLNADTGQSFKFAFKADVTITMFATKVGMLMENGRIFCGKIVRADMGIPYFVADNHKRHIELEQRDLLQFVKPRKLDSSKFDYAKVLIIAGSSDMSGAGALAANAAIKAGAGLVYLFTEKQHQALLPEVICFERTLDVNEDLITEILDVAKKCDTVLMGPGLSRKQQKLDLVSSIYHSLKYEKAIVLDADALYAVPYGEYTDRTVLTPHAGEFCKIFGVENEELFLRKFVIASAKKMETMAHIVLKGATTLILGNEHRYINTIGNSGMATAGAGDVLAGIIASYLFNSINLPYCSAMAVLHHSIAGNKAKEKMGESALTASEIIANL